MSAERESKQWWCFTEYGVKFVTGYSCKPANPDMWWCPEVGYSMTENGSLFGTEEAALEKAIRDTLSKIDSLQSQLHGFQDRFTAIRTP